MTADQCTTILRDKIIELEKEEQQLLCDLENVNIDKNITLGNQLCNLTAQNTLRDALNTIMEHQIREMQG